MNPEHICNLIANKDTKAILDIIEGLEAEIEANDKCWLDLANNIAQIKSTLPPKDST